MLRICYQAKHTVVVDPAVMVSCSCAAPLSPRNQDKGDIWRVRLLSLL